MIYFVSNDIFGKEDSYQTATIEQCLDYFRNHKYSHIAVDTETEGKDPHIKKILTVQLGNPDDQWVIDCRSIPISKLKSLLENNKLILHNSKFDYKFFKTHGINIEHIYDTFLAELIIYCGYERWGYGLAALTQRYCNVELSKQERGSFYKLTSSLPLTTAQILYASKDVKYLHDIMNQQLEKIIKYDLEYCLNLECEAIKSLADIELAGMEIDRERWLANSIEFEAKVKDLYNQLDNIVLNDPVLNPIYKPTYIQGNLFSFDVRELNINYSSPTQIKQLLEYLGITIESTEDRFLMTVKDRHKIIPVLRELRKAEKIVSTYGKDFLDSVNIYTGRIHTDFWPILNTGRVSSSEPNLQNIPKEDRFRNSFIPRKGYKWVSCDYQAQELRLMAEGSGEEGFIDILNKGEDLHCYVGTMMFRKPITKEDKEARNKAKTINFGKPYLLAA